jgi:hypothetical protein
MQDVVIDQQVVAEVIEVGSHVAEQSSDLGSKMDDVCWTVLLKDGLCGNGIPGKNKQDVKCRVSQSSSL